ncbi:MAG: tetratricopeptide repeat protein [Gammaproteobacteria bacterium]|nr:tetratricopeptide repeat protein [Gammaproteobacteria bacterium]MBU1776915.1 tetratricopeptide repeat protein [Gammaproteobacteria bacterium]MBU1968243.1 tetratricopeptide repeat protein [Gammaproteobacteria bacterium]
MNKLTNYFHQRDRGWMLSLMAAACLVYLPFLGNAFFFDDQYFFSTDSAGRHALTDFNFGLRWISYATLDLSVVLFSDAVPHLFHVGNLLLHAANVIALFYLLRYLMDALAPDTGKPSTVIWGAWSGALIFALHPVAVYAVGYVVQRSIVMATLFVLLMQMAFLRGLLTGRARWLVLAVACYFLAVFSKEHSVLAPTLLLALTWLLRAKVMCSKRTLWLTWAAFLAVGLLVTMLAKGVLGSPYEEMAAESIAQRGLESDAATLHLLSALTQAGLFFKYLALWLLPNVAWMSVDMREPFVATFSDWAGWLGLAGFCAYGVVALRLLLTGGGKGLVGFALLYPWLQFGVELVGVRVQEPFVLYRSYLWMPGLMLLVPLLFLHVSRRSMLLLPILAALILTPLSWNRLWILGDDYRLWNDAALLLKHEKVEGADRIYYSRGQALMALSKWEEAAFDFERAAAISPRLEPTRFLLGKAYLNAGRLHEALAQFDIAIALKDDDDRVYFFKGVALMRLHRGVEARQQFERSCKMKGNIAACLMLSSPARR